MDEASKSEAPSGQPNEPMTRREILGCLGAIVLMALGATLPFLLYSPLDFYLPDPNSVLDRHKSLLLKYAGHELGKRPLSAEEKEQFQEKLWNAGVSGVRREEDGTIVFFTKTLPPDEIRLIRYTPANPDDPHSKESWWCSGAN